MPDLNSKKFSIQIRLDLSYLLNLSVIPMITQLFAMKYYQGITIKLCSKAVDDIKTPP
jgi:hypothetical protein